MADVPGGDGPGAAKSVGKKLGWDEATEHLAKMIADKDSRIANQIETIRGLQADNDSLRARVCELEALSEEVENG